ncbi:class IIb bacteriocin, lactobin A/cerein 7B family [Moraxella nasibovis]|uniref:class IIb bacteriocin, lactobin A/cerein 7B family n=1 Tax=Moraxella nasibovis TaxID=2904120 RepID=UPI00240ED867|nr:class IIb bacteriocin, lactobin A/cerein 7B family [Moraxella nasibovis]WFF38437.1 class IIb bacteriocin, lactobin A/cerein 7B family [Moraxella nasibovis]
MRELSLNEVGMVSGGAGPVGAVAGAAIGATHYVVSNTLAGNDMSVAGLAGATAAGALTGSGFGMVAKGTQMAVSSIRAVQTTSNTVRAGMGTGAVSGTVDGLTQAIIKGGNTTNKDKAGTNYQ